MPINSICVNQNLWEEDKSGDEVGSTGSWQTDNNVETHEV